MSRKVDCKVDFKTRIEAIRHLKGQGFHVNDKDTWEHSEGFAATLAPMSKGDVNGPTLIAYNQAALASVG